MLANVNINIVINNNNSYEDDPNLKVNIDRICNQSDVPAIKFLGVYLDPKLNLKTLYYSLIHSHLVYAIHIWSSALNSTLNCLVKLQKKAIRVINHAPYNCHTEPLFKQCEILPLMYLVKFFKILFMYDYTQKLLPKSFENLWITNANRRNINPNYDRILRDDYLLYTVCTPIQT
jgi:hypothetical protein